MMRAMILGRIDTTEAEKRRADRIIEPATLGVVRLAFEHLGRTVEAGRVTARGFVHCPGAAQTLEARSCGAG